VVASSTYTHCVFGPEFCDGAVRIVRETGKPIAQVARELSLNEGTLGRWVNLDRRAREGEGPLNENERDEPNRLRKENAELAMERDVLKRSAARWRSLLRLPARLGIGGAPRGVCCGICWATWSSWAWCAPVKRQCWTIRTRWCCVSSPTTWCMSGGVSRHTTTVRDYQRIARLFLAETVGPDGAGLACIATGDVSGFVLARCRGRSPRWARLLMTCRSAPPIRR
jgi:transposase